ncbi:MAG: EF-hand domain-containing protein [Sphingobium sp.]
MKKSLLIAGAAIIAAAVPAMAAQQAPSASPAATSPAMKDITRAEVEAKVKEQFARYDTNKDGTVTREEISAQREAMRAQRQDERFKALDKDGNGAISRAEFDAGHADRWSGRGGKASADKADGTKATAPGARDGKHWRHGKGRMGHKMGGGMFAFGKADANKDGNITLAEATGAALAHFDKMDANKDGTVTAQERKDAMQQMREQWKKDGPRKDRAAPAQPQS